MADTTATYMKQLPISNSAKNSGKVIQGLPGMLPSNNQGINSIKHSKHAGGGPLYQNNSGLHSSAPFVEFDPSQFARNSTVGIPNH